MYTQTSIILGTSRSDGNTRKLVDQLMIETGAECYDLNDYAIGYYDYDNKNEGDDFLPLMREIVPITSTYVLVTPVYWYSMAAVMKTWMDRWSDLIRVHRDLGYQMRGRRMAAFSSSEGEAFPHMETAFRMSADYMKMQWLGHTHVRIDDEKAVPSFNDEYVSMIKAIKEQA